MGRFGAVVNALFSHCYDAIPRVEGSKLEPSCFFVEGMLPVSLAARCDAKRRISIRNENEDERRFSEGETARKEEEPAGEPGKATRKAFSSFQKDD